MKGKNLVIGLVLLIIVSCVAVYFAMQITINNMENGMEPIETFVDSIEGNSGAV